MRFCCVFVTLSPLSLAEPLSYGAWQCPHKRRASPPGGRTLGHEGAVCLGYGWAPRTTGTVIGQP